MYWLIYQQRSCWALSIDLQTGWLRKWHTLGRGRARLVTLTHLLTEQFVSTINWLTDFLTDKRAHPGEGVGVGWWHSFTIRDVVEHYQLTQPVDWQKDSHWVGVGVGWQHSVIDRVVEHYQLTYQLVDGGRKWHTLGRGRARLVALTHLLTEK